MIAGLHEFLERAKSLFCKRRLHDEMGEELEFHQTLLREKLLRQGVAPSQVDATLRRTFGNPGRWHERLRELWQFRTLETLMRDATFSVRMLKKSPGFTAVAVLTLALTSGTAVRGAVLAFIYGLGLGIPFIVVALAFQRGMTAFQFARRHAVLIARVGGGLLVLVGILEVSGAWTAADFGTRLGDGDTVGVVAFAGVDAAAGLAGEAVRLTRVSVS